MLTKKAKKILSDSQAIQGRLADAFGRSFISIQRWIEANDEMLTTAKALQIIREETGLSDDEILAQDHAA